MEKPHVLENADHAVLQRGASRIPLPENELQMSGFPKPEKRKATSSGKYEAPGACPCCPAAVVWSSACGLPRGKLTQHNLRPGCSCPDVTFGFPIPKLVLAEPGCAWETE